MSGVISYNFITSIILKDHMTLLHVCPGGCDIYDKVPPDLSQNSGRVATTSGKKCQNFWNEADYFITLRQN